MNIMKEEIMETLAKLDKIYQETTEEHIRDAAVHRYKYWKEVLRLELRDEANKYLDMMLGGIDETHCKDRS